MSDDGFIMFDKESARRASRPAKGSEPSGVGLGIVGFCTKACQRKSSKALWQL
jgi:hypothetical protein